MSAPADASRAMAQFQRWGAWAVALSVSGWLGYALWRGFTETASELGSFHWHLYGVVLVLTLVNYSLRFLKWHYLLGRLGIVVPMLTNAWVFGCGLAMVISPGKVGEFVKPYLIRRIHGASMTQTVPALVAERATDGLAVVLLAGVGVSTYYAEGVQLIGFALVVCAICLAVLAAQPLSLWCIDQLRWVRVLRGVADRLESAYVAMRTCLAPLPFVVTMLMSLLAWFAECLGYWLVFRGLEVSATVGQATFLYAFATVFGAPSPGGMGMADVALAEGSQALIPSLGGGQALAAALLIRLATLWLGVGMGAVALIRIERFLPASEPKAQLDTL